MTAAGTPACSGLSRASGETLAGTAPEARAWLVVEQPGHWGPKALAESGLEPLAATTLEQWSAHGIRPLLARHPLRPERSHEPVRYAWLACVLPGRESVLRLEFAEGALGRILEGLDPEALAAGDLSGWPGVPVDSLAFACTHGSRDTCCATVGRPVLKEAWSMLDDPLRLWECSHIGGHRFAPTALCLPSGAVLGRCDAHELAAGTRGELEPRALRGLSGLPAHQQAAHAAVVGAHGSRWLAASCADLDPASVRVTAPGGDFIDVQVNRIDTGTRVESCGAEPVPAAAWQAVLPA